MSDDANASVCDLCRERRVFTRVEELTFNQSTSRGNVFCRVRIPVMTCEACGARSWDAAAEAAIEQAVRQEFDKLK